MTRFPDWPERLAAWVESRRSLPFRWGENDCISSAASAVEAITGTDPLEGLRWSGLREAQRVLSENGGTVRAAVESRLGEAISPLYAQRGDVVLLGSGFNAECGEAMLSVCLGGVCASPGPNGLVFTPLSNGVACWRIPHA